MRPSTEDTFIYDHEDNELVQAPQTQDRWFRLLSKLFKVKQQPDSIPFNINIPDSSRSPSSSSCFTCGCCGFVFSLIFVIVGLGCLITVYSMWSYVIALSTTVTGLGVRGLGLQGHYTFTGIMSGPSQESINSQVSMVMSTASSNSTNPKVAILNGWFDLHSQRTDWNVVLFRDTFGLFLSPNPSGRFYLWAKHLNETTDTLEHAIGSPWNLNSVRVGSKTGNGLPEFLKQGNDDTRPLFYWFVVQSSQTTWSVPLSQ